MSFSLSSCEGGYKLNKSKLTLLQMNSDSVFHVKVLGLRANLFSRSIMCSGVVLPEIHSATSIS